MLRPVNWSLHGKISNTYIYLYWGYGSMAHGRAMGGFYNWQKILILIKPNILPKKIHGFFININSIICIWGIASMNGSENHKINKWIFNLKFLCPWFMNFTGSVTTESLEYLKHSLDVLPHRKKCKITFVQNVMFVILFN